MAVSSVGLRLKCDCSGKAQKQFNSKLQTRFLVREDTLKAERRNCPTKEEQDKIWSRIPKGGPIPRLTGRLTVGRKKNSNSNSYRSYSVLMPVIFYILVHSLTFMFGETLSQVVSAMCSRRASDSVF
jgi:hypothetical protein